MRASILAIWLFAFTCIGADVPKAPVPKSPFIAVVYRYADTLLERGRNMNDPARRGLFCSAMDRNTLAPLTNRPAAPIGVNEKERTIAKDGSRLTTPNPQHDENLLRVLYTLGELSANPKYREAADAELRSYLEQSAKPPPRRRPGLSVPVDSHHGSSRPPRSWLLWDQCFEISPSVSTQLALWFAEVRYEPGAAYELGAGFHDYGSSTALDRERQIGNYIRSWSVAYALTKDPQFPKFIQEMLNLDDGSPIPKPDSAGAKAMNEVFLSGIPLSPSLAMNCAGAAHRVSEPFASRLRAFVAHQDKLFCAAPHTVKSGGGFATGVRSVGNVGKMHTQLWLLGETGTTTAQIGMMCVSRYENSGSKDFLPLITAAADQYVDSLPPADTDVWPMTLGHAISLELAAWRHTAKPEYLARARKLGEWSVEHFWGTNALPRASLKTDHYETITGADSLALALMELHLSILHITAVRCPSNTID